jgi:hypothetical protein
MAEKLNLGTRWYLVIYYDANGNSIEAVKYDDSEIKQYISDAEFAMLERDSMVGIRAPQSWQKEYGIDNYTIRLI